MANQEYQASLKSADTEEHIDIYFYRPIGYQWARFSECCTLRRM